MNLPDGPRSRRSALIWAALAGAALALALPPFPLGFLAWIGVALWLGSLDGPVTPFRQGLLFGCSYGLGALFWIGWVTIPGTAALILISAAEYGLLAATYVRLRRRLGVTWALVAFPGLWLLLEKLRAAGVIGFPWLNLAHSQLDYVWLIQFVEFTGDSGLSVWVAAMGTLLYAAFRVRRPLPGMLAAVWLAAPLVFGALRVADLNQPASLVRVAVVQGDIDTYRKWDDAYIDYSFAVYDSMTAEVAHTVDLVIWPETAAPAYLKQEPGRRQWIEQLARRVDATILTGSLSYERQGEDLQIFNSAYAVTPDGRWDGPYSKQQLVPFGEMIPGAQWFPWLAEIELGQGNFQPGPGPVVFDSARFPCAVLICYESAFSGLAREQVLRGARFLVIMTNDSWYGRTSGPAQHAAMASLRAVEFRVGVARAANGGISLLTDRAGRRHDITRLFTRDLIQGPVELGERLTFYARHGAWLAWLVGLPGLVLFGLAWRPDTKR